MEAITSTLLRCVALLGMLVLSFAAKIDVKETVQGPSGDPVAQGPTTDTQTLYIRAPSNAQGPSSKDDMFSQGKMIPQFQECSKKCAIRISVLLLHPDKFASALSTCLAQCKVPESDAKKPQQPAADKMLGPQAISKQANSNSGVPFVCVQNCLSSMSKVITTNAKISMREDMKAPAPAGAAFAKPTLSDLNRYSEGYVDACYLGCNRDPKLF